MEWATNLAFNHKQTRDVYGTYLVKVAFGVPSCVVLLLQIIETLIAYGGDKTSVL